MRVYWILLSVLVLGGVGIPLGLTAVNRASVERARPEIARLKQIADRERRSIESDIRKSLDDMDDEASSASSEEIPVSPTTETASPVTTQTLSAEPPPAPSPSPTPAPTPTPAPVTPPATPVVPATTPPATAPAATTPPKADATDSKPVETAEPPKIVKKDDGSMLVDDRFIVKGEGTQEKPYEITWELLVSANETYDPRVGRKKLPGRVTMLEGKFVRITGYVAYPLFVEQPKECLMMLNQWDGCCIGVPPSPYDAVEVKLKKTVSQELRMATYGVVEGKFSAKPYLAGDWLVGLYIMDQCTLTAKQYNGAGQ